MVDLSIIIVSFNTRDVTKKCLDSVFSSFKKNKGISWEIIVVDNGSSDGSVKLLKSYQKIRLILNKKNTGFGRPNNQGLRISHGKNILYLNSDVILKRVNFEKLLTYLDANPQVAGLTVRVVLSSGGIDPASHRGFPTPWNAFCYYFELEKYLGCLPWIGKYFGGYHLTYLDLNSVHEIDCPTAAFFLVRSKILKKINGFDENYFLYGEYVDLAFRIKKLAYKIIYYPLYEVIHLKSVSGLKKKTFKVKSKTRGYFYDSMKIFYNKYYLRKYPWFIKKLVFFFIDLKKKIHENRY